ncbi:hypothetical protein [Nonomuraea salmonea]|uniref:hypothetical protein n=1 Tax=Nonomuraea salmonea TaxID=46181 RepID=UPI002FEAE975
MATTKPVNPSYVPGRGAPLRRVPTTEVRPAWETSALPDWVNYTFIPLFTAGEPWPADTRTVELGRAAQLFDSLAATMGDAVDKTGTAVGAIDAGYTSPAKPPAFTVIRRQFDDKTGVVAKANQAAQLAEHFASFALEADFTKRSINIAFWVSVTAAALGIVAVSSPFAALVVRLSAQLGSVRAQLLLRRLLLVAGRAGPATGAGRTVLAAGAGSRFLALELATEMPEELLEGLASLKAQRDQIKEGLRDEWDWQLTNAIIVGTVIGTATGVWLGRHMAGYIDRLPGIGTLYRTAGARTGVLPAFQRYPRAVLATALPNVPGSVAGQVGAGVLVYGDPGRITLESLVGAAAAGGFRANTYSPFNVHVMGAAVRPTTTLSNYAASMGTHLAGTTTDGYRPATHGTGPSPDGPRPAATAPPQVVPHQWATPDLSVQTTRDVTDTLQQRLTTGDLQRLLNGDRSPRPTSPTPHMSPAPDVQHPSAPARHQAPPHPPRTRLSPLRAKPRPSRKPPPPLAPAPSEQNAQAMPDAQAEQRAQAEPDGRTAATADVTAAPP